MISITQEEYARRTRDQESRYKPRQASSLTKRKYYGRRVGPEREARALILFQQHKTLTKCELAELLNVGWQTALNTINTLVAQGQVVRLGSKRSGKYAIKKTEEP